MITQFLSNDLTYAMAWTLVHSLWQITLVALILSMVLKYTSKVSPHSRYLIAFAALGIVVVSALVTFAIYFLEGNSQTQTVVASFSGEYLMRSELQGETHSFFALVDKYLFVIVNVWVLGSLLFLLKIVGGYTYLRRLVKEAGYEEEQVTKKLNKLKKKYKIQRDLILKTSHRISSPMVIGFIKPVILFPVGLVNQLSTEEVVAILAHELAHIKRHDFLFNLIQSITEALFYFHPGIWFISSAIRTERESCCDDLAIEVTGNKVSYAKTLIKLQEMNLSNLQPAVAMAGSKGHFSHRIKRIMDVPVHGSQLKERLIAMLLVCFTMIGFANDKTVIPAEAKEDLDIYIIDDCPSNLSEIKYYLDTIPDRNNFHIKKRSHQQDLELTMEDGEIRELKIDGEVVAKADYDKVEDLIVELTPDGKQEVITVFPDCGKDFGNIYFIDKDREVFVLDSILEGSDVNLRKFEDQDSDLFNFHIDKFDNRFMDSLKQEINSVDWVELTSKDKFPIDSILDLLPNKFPQIGGIGNDYNSDKAEFFIDSIFKGFEKKDVPATFSHLDDYHVRTLSFPNCRTNNIAEQISSALLSDRIVDDKATTRVVLTGKHLKIDGEKQPSNLWRKYKELYEELTGIKMSKSSQIEIEVIPAEIKKKVCWPDKTIRTHTIFSE